MNDSMERCEYLLNASSRCLSAFRESQQQRLLVASSGNRTVLMNKAGEIEKYIISQNATTMSALCFDKIQSDLQ